MYIKNIHFWKTQKINSKKIFIFLKLIPASQHKQANKPSTLPGLPVSDPFESIHFKRFPVVSDPLVLFAIFYVVFNMVLCSYKCIMRHFAARYLARLVEGFYIKQTNTNICNLSKITPIIPTIFSIHPCLWKWMYIKCCNCRNLCKCTVYQFDTISHALSAQVY